MGTRRIVLFAALGVVFCGFASLLWPQPPEPAYNGKTLSQWLEDCVSVQDYSFDGSIAVFYDPASDDAIGHIGTNAIPTLLRLLRAKDSGLKMTVMRLASHQRVIRLKLDPEYVLHQRASYGFRALGAEASNAVPDLIRILNENVSDSSQIAVIQILRTIGPAASDAVPALLPLTTNGGSFWVVRAGAADALGQIHAQPELVLPRLITLQGDPNGIVREAASNACTNFDPETVAKIIANNQSTNNPAANK